MRTKMSYWLAQFFGWGFYCLMLLMAVNSTGETTSKMEMYVTLFSIYIFGILFTHIQRWIILKFGWLNIKIQRLLPRILLSSLILSACMTLGTLVAEVIAEGTSFSDIDARNIIISSFFMMFLTWIWNSFYFTYHYIRKSRRQEISNLALEASNKESELKNLRNQLNPHFLFNSLNSIRALIEIEPKKAKKSITTLSNLLRQSLVLGKENLVDVEKELEISHSYLELEKIRFEERLLVEYNIDERLYGVKIPPFSLQMLVENAVKHGVSQLKEGGRVIVTVNKCNGKLCLEVKNSGSLGSSVDLGVGLQNIRKRLKLQFGNKADFSIRQEGDYVIAVITIEHEGI